MAFRTDSCNCRYVDNVVTFSDSEGSFQGIIVELHRKTVLLKINVEKGMVIVGNQLIGQQIMIGYQTPERIEYI